jgi:hypothetical protein
MPQTVPPAILSALAKITIFQMQENAWKSLEKGDVVEATRRLETMATRLLDLGEHQLARAALLEAGRLARSGHLSPAGRKAITLCVRRRNKKSDKSTYTVVTAHERYSSQGMPWVTATCIWDLPSFASAFTPENFQRLIDLIKNEKVEFSFTPWSELQTWELELVSPATFPKRVEDNTDFDEA